MTRTLRGFLAVGICLSFLAEAVLAEDAFTSIDVPQVKLGGEIGRRIDVTCRNNLMQLNVEGDFLAPFRTPNRAEGYIGLGKTIDAAVRLAAYTGDEAVLARKRQLVAETIRLQQPDGYIGLIQPDKRVWALWDIHEMGYIVYGLVSDFRYFREEPSLQAARKLADFIVSQWSAKPDGAPGGGTITVHMAVTGIESAMLALHSATQDRRYLDFCVQLRKLPDWNARIVTGRWGQIEGHAYAYMCRCIAQLRLNRLQPDDRLLKPAHDAIDFLTTRDGLVVTGACGDHECWHDTQEGTINLGETCATAYLIRMLDELLRVEAKSQYGDLMERAIYNALFAAQSPDGRKLRYYSPFDGPRAYFDGDTYCCPCNYRRIVAELPGMAYYRSGDGVVVNLYVASSASIPIGTDQTVSLRQETSYPNEGQVRLHVEPQKPGRFTLRLRIPAWCGAATVAVNAEAAAQGVKPGTFCELDREWKSGDTVRLELPMAWRLVKGRKAQAGRVAVMRGPQVFCLNRARHEKLADMDLRLMTIDPASLEGPLPDDSVHPGGLACRLRAWGPGRWYPHAPTDLELTLTEFPDPGGEATYFKVPNPNADSLADDELSRSR
jgi:DUF1680 family protein